MKKDFKGYEREVNTRITLTEYHDLRNISDFIDFDQSSKLGHEITDLLNSYTELSGGDKIAIMKNVALQLIDQGVKGYLEYKKKEAVKKMQRENK